MDRRIVIPHADVQNSYTALLRAAVARCGWSVEHVYPLRDYTPAVTWIHWPEAMVGWQEPAREELLRFEKWMRARAETGLVLWTVHNAFPHAARRSVGYRELYRIVAENAQVHLHHGRASIRVIAARYPSAHPSIITTYPHGGYWQLLGDMTPAEARRRLNLDGKGKILLVFGEVRDPRELRLILHATRAPEWHVLMAGRLPSPRNALWAVMNRLALLITASKWTVVPGPIPDHEVDVYVKAADALFIPRYEALNSGNVFLGFTFGKPVIGPAIGNIGEVLTLTGNPTFDPRHVKSIAWALAAVRREELAALGTRNAQWLLQNCQWDQTAAVAVESIEQGMRQLGLARPV